MADEQRPAAFPVRLNDQDAAPSSSPAFGTPLYPVAEARSTFLPILIPPASLRPLAFRTFTKKHGLTLTSTALQALATFIGKNCGSEWRQQGLAEQVLEEVARIWKRNKGIAIMEGGSQELQEIFKVLEGSMQGGRLVSQPRVPQLDAAGIARQEPDAGPLRIGNDLQVPLLRKEDSNVSLAMMGEEDEENLCLDPRKWLRVVNAFDQPRLLYNPSRKHFEKNTKPASLIPDPSHKTLAFRDRYNVVLQRILRNETFQNPTLAQSRAQGLQRSASTVQQLAYKITPVANLLGRTGSSHVLAGLLTMSPTGSLVLSDLTGNVGLDLSHAKPVPEEGSWVCPGMIVVIEGTYEEEGLATGLKLGGGGGVGGSIGGRFVAASVGGPPCERRHTSLGLGEGAGESEPSSGGGFGWVDFLGVGSERARGPKMRLIEKRLLKTGTVSRGRNRIVCLGELHLDNSVSRQAIRQVLGVFASGPAADVPMAFVLTGSFSKNAAMASGKNEGNIEYKESFDLLASVLSEYPSVLQSSTFIFVPGDNDPWASSFSKGSAAVMPRRAIPDLFTSRIKRSFTAANGEADRLPVSEMDGEAIWASNPTRITLFGPMQEIVVFRDDISGRLRRSAVHFKAAGGAQRSTDLHQQAVGQQASSDANENHMNGDQEMEDSEPNAGGETDGSEPTYSAQGIRKLVKTVVDQGYLSPFPIANRPVLWDWTGSLQLYPLPSALFMVDAELPPFAITYEGCHVVNPGKLVADGRKNIAQWIEYDTVSQRGSVCEIKF